MLLSWVSKMAKSAHQSDKTDEKQLEEHGKQELMYLHFVAVAATWAVVCLASLYDFAKQNAGPLKPVVRAYECAVKALVGPFFDKFHDVPFGLLKFADREVAGVIQAVDPHVPALVKQVTKQAYAMAQEALSVACSLVTEVYRTGIIATATNTTRKLISRLIKEFTARCMGSLINNLPLFPHLWRFAVPTALHWSEKYNDMVARADEQRHMMAPFLPLMPIDKMANAFGMVHESSVASGTSKSE